MGYLAAAVLGFIVGHCLKDRQQERINQAQQERGDYWFDRCQQLAHELTEDRWR